MRRHNLALVLQLLTGRGPHSRAAIAEAIGVTKATASKLVADLVERSLVHDVALVQGSSGRPATLVDVSDERIVAVGLVIDVDTLSVGAVDLHGRTHHVDTVAIDNRGLEPARVVRRAGALVRTIRDRLSAEGRTPVGLTVAVPGLTSDGHVLVAPNLGWQDVAVAKLLDARIGGDTTPGSTRLPIEVDNEANLAALAEARVRDERTFILVSAGVGVGAGVVVDGALFRGAHGFGGELGHFVVDPVGRSCRCGNRGCVETIVGKDALLRAAGRRAPRAAAGSPPDDTAWIERLADLAAAGDDRTLTALGGVADALASGLAAAVSLFDPESIVLGGYLTGLTPWLAPEVERQLARRVLGSRWVDYPVHASTIGPRASLIGAGWATIERIIADPLSVPTGTTR